MSEERQPDFGGGNVPQGGAYPAGGGYAQPDDDDFKGAADHASRHVGEGSTDRDLFSTLASTLSSKKQSLSAEEIDEDDAVKQHKRYFDKDDDEDAADDKSMGSAAAMQALKMFTGGQSGSSAEGNSQSAFIGLAMAEASKLFDQKASQGKVSDESSKESAVLKAGEMALKMYLKSQGGATAEAGSGSASSASGLLNLASKFLK